jgi:hypothetical protein
MRTLLDLGVEAMITNQIRTLQKVTRELSR